MARAPRARKNIDTASLSRAMGEHLGRVGRASTSLVLFVTTVFLFACSLTTVFYGFVAYSSRVNLASEFQNIDFVFMTLGQLEKDEADIAKDRAELIAAVNKADKDKIELQVTAFTSSEFSNFFATYSDLVNLFEKNRSILNGNYAGKIYRVDFEKPDLEQVSALLSPEYVSDASGDATTSFTNELNVKIKAIRPLIIAYIVKYGASLDQMNVVAKGAREAMEAKIKEIGRRYPHLIYEDEKKTYGITEKSTLDLSQVDKQRAIIRSYDQGLAGLRIILRWPTIVLTLLVTLAAGLLGGTVSFLGPVLRSQHPDGGIDRSEFVELVRRCMLGITAALGIFLFAGSGLLVLTAQSGKALTSNSLELSPYFVAFLAFISGFLADDTFRRLTEAGRAILQARGAGVTRRAGVRRPAAGRRSARKR
jgi:hypothetical protein